MKILIFLSVIRKMLVQQKKTQVDSKRKDIQGIDKFSAGRTKCRYPMLKRTWWNSLALFLIGYLQGVLKQ